MEKKISWEEELGTLTDKHRILILQSLLAGFLKANALYYPDHTAPHKVCTTMVLKITFSLLDVGSPYMT